MFFENLVFKYKNVDSQGLNSVPDPPLAHLLPISQVLPLVPGPAAGTPSHYQLLSQTRPPAPLASVPAPSSTQHQQPERQHHSLLTTVVL